MNGTEGGLVLLNTRGFAIPKNAENAEAVSYTHLDVYKRQAQDTAEGGGDCAPDPADLEAYKGGCVDGQRAGGHLGYGDDVCKHGFTDPPGLIYHLFRCV